MSSSNPLFSSPSLTTWQTIYPIYLNSNKTISEGRRTPLKYSISNPSIVEIAEVLKFLKVTYVIEKKSYSRDYLQIGRIKILLKQDGKPVNIDIPNKDVLLKKIGVLLNELPSRQQALNTSEIFSNFFISVNQGQKKEENIEKKKKSKK